MSRHPAAACGQKIPHLTREAAAAAMRSWLRSVHGRRPPVSVYRCRSCGAWHWGHTPGQDDRRLR